MYHTHYAQVYLKLGQFAYGFDSGPKKTQLPKSARSANAS